MTEYEPCDVACFRAQSYTYSNLVCALPRDKAHHTVHTREREYERKRGEATQQSQVETSSF
jgi:hypothetical protein